MKEICFACEHCKNIKNKEYDYSDVHIYRCNAMEILLDVSSVDKEKCEHFHPED